MRNDNQLGSILSHSIVITIPLSKVHINLERCTTPQHPDALATTNTSRVQQRLSFSWRHKASNGACALQTGLERISRRPARYDDIINALWRSLSIDTRLLNEIASNEQMCLFYTRDYGCVLRKSNRYIASEGEIGGLCVAKNNSLLCGAFKSRLSNCVC